MTPGPIQPATYAPPASAPRTAGRAAPSIPAPTPPAISAASLGSVVAALKTEAATLRRADDAAAAADTVLTEAAGRLAHPTRQNAAHRLTRDAAHADVPLFDGRFALHVAGATLRLPDFTSEPPTPPGVAAARGRVDTFRTRVVAPRLGVVEATLHAAHDARRLVPADGRGTQLDVVA
ncbi:MAG: hypothetical protein AAF710_03140 [Planctomycetota bacterium]